MLSRVATDIAMGALVIAEYLIARVVNDDGKSLTIGTLLNLALLLIVTCLIAAGILRLLRRDRADQGRSR
jgi:nitrogen fixation/metabolism regulation signal transduction histidine kinase